MRIVLERLLRKNFPSITAVGESETAEKALEEVPSFAPDLVLVDISLPGMDGIEMIRRLKPRCPTICILVVTGHEIDLYERAAREAGADDIVSKYENDRLPASIRTLVAKRALRGCG